MRVEKTLIAEVLLDPRQKIKDAVKEFRHTVVPSSKYAPHVGKKQLAKAAKRKES